MPIACKSDKTNPPPSASRRRDSVAEILLMKHLEELSLRFLREYRFDTLRLRQWRFDFIVDDLDDCSRKVAIEIEGGIWTHGAHVRGKHFESDLRKYNEAAKLGWTVIRFTPNMIERGESKAFLAELFGRKV